MSLTPRQQEVARLVAKGMSAKRIARHLAISTDTVAVHIREAASRLPGDGRPRWKLQVFVWRSDEQDAA